ncbi:MAG: tRNA (adenosine(37)-N6)-threonylcarbamoyltransferase complex ATPase subunit type 1 TsaE [Gammaproteobacteria bacterium]|jgi:tRNA threonylcarbamoyladenosine biosynthesis protein TsaE|nr:tRNA (adenosine(37)-N6)-threonylcarbamoyltransferase complex ATPase subunit type 1 TsaE [Gammaproteobacteria bacterium]|tara:strand:- start:13984 stop:14421 length:438 start_codon:yes stop_codon:yes gene_type:complete
MILSNIYNHYHLSAISHYNKIFDEINFMPHEKVIIYLYGQVGAGKTTFVKSYLNYLDSNSEVSSPTFSLVNEYMINDLKIFHYDLYRINSIKELYEIGVDYYFEQAGLHFIEWPDKFASELPISDFDIYFLSLESSRLVKIHRKT